jgi:hypothetical protein
MPIFGPAKRFTRNNVDLAPDEPGVYALVVEGDIAFYGCSRGDETIRSRLSDHLAGRQAPGREVISAFSYEVTRFTMARECALLEEHLRRTWQLPTYNRQLAGRVAPAAGPTA